MSSIYGEKSNKWQLRLDYSVSQSDNKSTISMTLYIYDGTGYSQNQDSSSCYYILNGSKTYNKYTYNSTGWYKLGTGTKTVTHNDDGTAPNATISASWHSGFNSSYTPSSLDVSGSVPLPTIPRASKITSASNVTIGNACSVKWTPASSSFKYKVRFTISSDNTTTGDYDSGWSSTYIQPKTTSAYTYTATTIPTDVAKRITTSTTGTMTVQLNTYDSSGTKIGSTYSKEFTVTVPSSYVPTVGDISASIVNGYSSLYVQGQSSAKLTISSSGTSGSNGSTIKKYYISGSFSKTYTSCPSNVSTGIFSTSGTKTFYAQVEDSRGRLSAKKSVSITVYSYANPTIKLTSISRSSSNVTLKYTTSYSSINSTNSIYSIKIYRKLSTEDTYSTSAFKTISSDFNGSTTVADCNTNCSYDFYAVITDNAYRLTGTSNTVRIGTDFKLINLTKDSVAIGGLAEETKKFKCDLASTFNEAVTFNKTIDASGRITGAGFTSSSTINSSGNITVTRSGSEPTVKVDNGTNSCSIMVGASTNNAGLYNHTKGAWDVYRDSSGALKMAGHTITGDTTCLVSGGDPYISVNNGTKKCGIYANTSNNRGLYDSTAGKWDIYRDSDDNLTVATCNIVSGSTIGGYTPLTSNNYSSYAATKGHNHREDSIGHITSTTSYQKVNSTATNCKCFLVRISKSSVYFSTVVYIGTIGDEYTYGISVGTDYISFTCKLDSSGYFYIKRGTTPHYTFYVYGII